MLNKQPRIKHGYASRILMLVVLQSLNEWRSEA